MVENLKWTAFHNPSKEFQNSDHFRGCQNLKKKNFIMLDPYVKIR